MKKIEKEDGILYIRTSREIKSLWNNLTKRHLEDWTFVLNPPKMKDGLIYGLYVDETDGFGDLFPKPQMGVLNATGVLRELGYGE